MRKKLVVSRGVTWPTKHEIRKFSRRSRAATTKKCTMFFFEACLTCSIALLTFSLPSSSSLLKLPVVFAWLTCVAGLFFECNERSEPRERMSKQVIHRRLAMGFAYVDCEKGKLTEYSFALDQYLAKICTYHACILSFSFLLLFCFLFRLPRVGLLLLLCCFWIYTRRVYP